MARKLLRFSTILAVPAIGLGLWLWLGFGFHGVWLHAKLLVVLLSIVYHIVCGQLYRQFAQGNNLRSHVWFRWFNEIPVFLLSAAVLLVVLKPF